MDEAFSIAGADLGAVGDADKLGVKVEAVLGVEFLARRDDERLEDVASLCARRE